jgi:hypothetical protein
MSDEKDVADMIDEIEESKEPSLQDEIDYEFEDQIESDMIEDLADKNKSKKANTWLKDRNTYNLKGGLMRNPNTGEIKKSKMFELLKLDLDDYSDVELTAQEMRRFHAQLLKMRHAHKSAVPLLCPGPVKCPFALRCPFVDKSLKTDEGEVDLAGQNVRKFPLARQCPVEKDLFESKLIDYIEEYEIDIESPTQMGLVAQLAELDIYDYRVSITLSKGDYNAEGQDLMKLQTSSIAMNGKEIKRLEEHPAFALKERLHKQRMDILDVLVGTPKSQYKKEVAMGKTREDDPSNNMSRLRDKLIRLEVAKPPEDVIDAVYVPSEEPKDEE